MPSRFPACSRSPRLAMLSLLGVLCLSSLPAYAGNPPAGDAAAVTEAAGKDNQDLEQVVQQHAQRGYEFFTRGAYDEAIQQYRAAYQLDAQPIFLFKVARCYHKSGQSKEALELYQRFLHDDPNSPLRAETLAHIKTLEDERAAEARPLWKKPWFWCVVAGATVVVGVGLGVGLGLGHSSSTVITK